MSRVAEGVSPLELADYQKAVRLVLRHPLIAHRWRTERSKTIDKR